MESKSRKIQKIETLLTQAGLVSDEVTGAISTPIHQTATFRHAALGHSTGFDYSRTLNPTRKVLEDVMAKLEGGERAFAFASGMAALTAVAFLFKTGDEVLVSDDLYGGTYRLFEQVFRPYGVTAHYVDTSDLGEVKKSIREQTKALLVETPTNPLMKISDLGDLVKIAKSRNLLVIVDNTFMTPLLQRPLELGADIVVHSGTKYLAGHNDVLCGIVVTAGPALSDRIAFFQNATGGVLGPMDCWLAVRGLKTLHIRLERAQENAGLLAKKLSLSPAVKAVYYPGLPSHPGREAHFRQASGPGAMLSFRVADRAVVERVLRSVKVISFAESLGGVETLITYPVTQTHADIPEDVRRRIGVTDDLLRVSVGIEAAGDIISDLEQALG